MSEKKKWLVVIVRAEVYPMQVEAKSAAEAEQLGIAEYESKVLEPTEQYYYVEDVLEEN